MANTVVLARAYGGEPLQRVVVGRGPRTVHIANPDYLEAIREGQSSPVGFPEDDIFVFSSKAYETLCEQWQRNGVTDQKVWDGLLPYRD